jgi:hypothetical protein
MERVESGNWRLLRRRARDGRRALRVLLENNRFRHAHLVERATRKFFALVLNVFLLGGGERFAALRARADALHDFDLSDDEWEGFRIPIDLAFVFRSTPAQGPVAMYPGRPARSSLLAADGWSRLVDANPMLAHLDPDVEALLVNRMNGARNTISFRLIAAMRSLG